jgi:hypothetical protein
MVMVKGATLPAAFVHCIGDSFGLTPRLTVTTHRGADGDAVWYLGGELAEQGTARSPADQIQAARVLLHELFPRIVTDDCQWASFAINRAEGQVAGQHRPDSVFVESAGKLMLCWPTKFTLSPALADAVVLQLHNSAVRPGGGHSPLPDDLPRPVLASPPWEVLF